MMPMATACAAINASAVADPYTFAVSGTRLDLAEYCCSPDSILSEKVIGDGGTAKRFNLAKGFDFYKMNDVQRACQAVLKERPHEMWFSLPCRYWSSIQNLNRGRPVTWEKIRKGRQKERKMIRNVLNIIKCGMAMDSTIVWEWPAYCQGWNDHSMNPLRKVLDHEVRIDGCRVNLRDPTTGALVWKPWKLWTNDKAIVQRFKKLRCCHPEKHPILDAGIAWTSYYPDHFAMIYAKGLMKPKINPHELAQYLYEYENPGEDE